MILLKFFHFLGFHFSTPPIEKLTGFRYHLGTGTLVIEGFYVPSKCLVCDKEMEKE